MAKSFVTWFFLLCLFLALPANVEAARVTGEGATKSAALNDALQQAVEMVVGAAIEASTLVEEGELIRDDVVSHAKGYVSGYDVIDKGERDGGHFIKIDARVNEGLIQNGVESLEILMKVAGRPKVLVVGLDDDMDSLSAFSGQFSGLTRELGKLFKEKFRFRLLDREDAIRNAGSTFTPKPNKSEALDMARAAEADIALFVKVNARPSKESRQIQGRLILEAIRVSDSFNLGESKADFFVPSKGSLTLSVANERLVLDEAKEHFFRSGLKLARLVVESIQRETERGAGFRYVLSFFNFPEKVMKQILSEETLQIEGYVRHKVEKMSGKKARVAYWSHLDPMALDAKISKILSNQEVGFRHKMEGRSLSYKWRHPDFD